MLFKKKVTDLHMVTMVTGMLIVKEIKMTIRNNFLKLLFFVIHSRSPMYVENKKT